MSGFILKNTLSENGSVTRGICKLNDCGQLTSVHETSNIVKTEDGAAVKEGYIFHSKPGGLRFHEYVGIDTGIYGKAGDRL